METHNAPESKAGPHKPERKRSRFRIAALIRKRRVAVSILGAIIVFITFIAKEVLRDRYKDQLDSLESGESLYVIRDDNEKLRDQILMQGGFAASAQTPLRVNPSTLDGRLYYYQQQLGYAYDGLRRLAVTLERTTNLASKLPYNKNYKENADRLNRALEANKQTFDNMNGYFARTSSQRPLTDTEKQDFLNRATGWHDQLGTITDDIYDLSDNTVKEAKQERVAIEAKYQLFKYLSYVFYTIGSVLTIVGLAAGVEVPGNG